MPKRILVVDNELRSRNNISQLLREVVALTFFGVHLENLLRAPAIGKFALLIIMLLFVFLGHRWLCRQFVAAQQPVVADPTNSQS